MKQQQIPSPFQATMKMARLIDHNPDLQQRFKEASMQINLQGKFWVNKTLSHLGFMKKPLCYDAKTKEITTPSYNDMPYRLTMAFFYKGELQW